MARTNITFNMSGWRAIAKHVVETEGVKRMKRVADACNQNLDRDGYLVSVEGDQPLAKHDYRATVITATEDAMYDNQKTNALVREFHHAGGD